VLSCTDECQFDCGRHHPLPVPPVGWFNYGYALLCDGALALVRTDRDIHADYKHWRALMAGGDLQAPWPGLYECQLRLSKFVGSVEMGSVEVSAPNGGSAAWGRQCAPDEAEYLVYVVSVPAKIQPLNTNSG
jgi:hypothetical protein